MDARRSIAVASAIALAACDVTEPDADGLLLSPVSQNDLAAEISAPLPLSVRVSSGGGDPRAGVTVVWQIDSGSGRVEPASVQTSSDGIATTSLLPGPGTNHVRARIERTQVSRIFTAHGCSACGEWSVVPVDIDSGGRAWAATTSIGGRIWLIGGEAGSRPAGGVHVFDPSNLSWQKVGDAPRDLSGSLAAAVNGRIYLFGGFDWHGYNYVGAPNAFVFDPAPAVWEAATHLSSGRFFAAGAAVGERVSSPAGTRTVMATPAAAIPLRALRSTTRQPIVGSTDLRCAMHEWVRARPSSKASCTWPEEATGGRGCSTGRWPRLKCSIPRPANGLENMTCPFPARCSLL